jgi:hypothetical protein
LIPLAEKLPVTRRRIDLDFLVEKAKDLRKILFQFKQGDTEALFKKKV